MVLQGEVWWLGVPVAVSISPLNIKHVWSLLRQGRGGLLFYLFIFLFSKPDRHANHASHASPQVMQVKEVMQGMQVGMH